MDTKELQKLIAIWFEEDIRDGDHTSLSCIPETEMGCQQLIVKEEGIIAGIEVAKEIIAYFDPECRMEQLIEDGTHVKPGDIAFRVYGKELSLLQIERTMLNVMQRMSGVATTAHKYQSLIPRAQVSSGAGLSPPIRDDGSLASGGAGVPPVLRMLKGSGPVEVPPGPVLDPKSPTQASLGAPPHTPLSPPPPLPPQVGCPFSK